MRATPIVVNMFAGPGAGKSNLAALVYSELKSIGSPVVAELAVEFAKELVFEGRKTALANQALVLGEQMQRIERLVGQVDVVITDSPVLMSAIYVAKDYPTSFTEFALWAHRRFPTFDVFVERHGAPYETHGRVHTEEEARAIDARMLEFLKRHAIGPLHFAKPTRENAHEIVTRVLDRLIEDQAA